MTELIPLPYFLLGFLYQRKAVELCSTALAKSSRNPRQKDALSCYRSAHSKLGLEPERSKRADLKSNFAKV